MAFWSDLGQIATITSLGRPQLRPSRVCSCGQSWVRVESIKINLNRGPASVYNPVTPVCSYIWQGVFSDIMIIIEKSKSF